MTVIDVYFTLMTSNSRIGKYRTVVEYHIKTKIYNAKKEYDCGLNLGFVGYFLPARRYASAGNSHGNVSVRPSVRHAPVLCQNEES